MPSAKLIERFKDLATYGLLEPQNNEKAVQKNDFPSEKMIGDPAPKKV